MFFDNSILTICMGGTICSKICDNSRGLQQGVLPSIIEQKLKHIGCKIDIVCEILSENINFDNLKLLVKTINLCSESVIFILAGTDFLTLMAKFVALSVKPNKQIFFISSQRSPDTPTFEGVNKIDVAYKCINRVNTGVYIINMKDDIEYQFLDPYTSNKICGYEKNCFRGIINYVYNRLLNTLTPMRPVKRMKQLDTTVEVVNFENVNIIYPMPNMPCYVPAKATHVLVIGTGLCNISDIFRDNIINKYKHIKFYIVNNLSGQKYKVYDLQKMCTNEIVKSEDVELAYLKVLYDKHY